MSRKICPDCGGKLNMAHLPEEIRVLLRERGLPDPVWYVGRLHCPAYAIHARVGNAANETRHNPDA